MNNFILFLVPTIIWGSTWLAITFQLTVNPLYSIIYRFILASGILFVYSFTKKLPLKFPLKVHKDLFLLGITLFGFNYFFTYTAEQNLTSGLVALCFSTMVIFNSINARIFLKQKINFKVILGGIIGLIGLSILFKNDILNFTLSSTTTKGIVLTFAGAYCASLGNIISAKIQKENIPIIQSNTFGMLYGALSLLLIALISGKIPEIDTSFSYITALLYLSIFGSVIAFGSYLKLLGRIGPQKAVYITLLIPIVAIVLSAVFENLSLQPHSIIGILIVLAGNYIALKR
ncbi:conserved hypothetical protein [Thermotomaculum hydrothermale]|uniref:EamA domain-containing protein n=1 Tax=Thermotomaculum hydrothermale TaxID=981385 RepID=A0A7R6PHU4_9BACT|nr:EamA family transporter [Thermotomaculum hydrothermale]BBB32889.1 conserved hypothetical protein [Thermotomaculum hydrothermale]